MIRKPGDRGSAEGRLLLFGTTAALIVTASSPADAAGFYLQEQSVRGWGRANSGEVADRGPASLWWNPASIGGATEAEASFGATAIFPAGKVNDAGTLIDRPVVPPAPVGGISSLSDPIQRGVAPNNAFALPLSDRIAIGLAVSAPFSFTSDYDPSGWQRYSAIRSRLITLDIQPSLAVAATDWLSVGAALNIEYSDAWLSNALPNLAPGSPDARLRLTGNGWDLGWSAGVQLRPAERVTIGLAYKSAVEHKLEGPVDISGLAGPLAARNINAPTTARFTTPWQLTAGARIGVTPGLTLNAQAVRFGWSKFDSIDIGAPLSSAIVQNYKDTWSVAFGLDQELGKKLTLRAGIQIDPTPTRDSFRNPRVPDGDRIDYNVGASYRLSKRIAVDAAAGYTDLENGPIGRDERFYAGTPAQTDVLTDGRAQDQHVIVLAMGGRISF
ncbi:MAG: long-chain fatty acid transport protein [Sphingomonadales bacterium]|jgi:long-chain fatty acid transport protein|nr:long-chain fatty acid transport protein [Sphingomonadales bacterium]